MPALIMPYLVIYLVGLQQGLVVLILAIPTQLAHLLIPNILVMDRRARILLGSGVSYMAVVIIFPSITTSQQQLEM